MSLSESTSWADSELSALLDGLSPEEQDRLLAPLPWIPNPGPQAEAYLSLADELYFGGAAGGGKTQLAIGLALTAHRDSLILRRRAVDAKSLSKAIKGLGYGSWTWSGSGGELRLPGGRSVEVGGCEHVGDEGKYQGNPHDLVVFDELPHFAESQYTFIIGWNRPLDPRRHPNQRCRVVAPGNPPTTAEGQRVLRRWAAWFPGHANPAAPGELRWYTTIGGEEVECPDSRPVVSGGQSYAPRSRTFIPARLEDNPELMRTGYAATLDAMPEPLRSMLRHGDMLASRQDDRWQLVPTKWVVLANRRWVERRADPGPLAAVGVDVAMMGEDWTVLAPRRGARKPEGGATVTELVKRRGRDTPDGSSVVALITSCAWGEDGVPYLIDAIGIGKSAVDVARTLGIKGVVPVVASAATHWRDPRHPQLKFANLRAAMMWRVRSLLDPEGGPPETRLALPPDPELLADLTAPRYELRVSGVAVESKDEIRKRIGRSTDSGDAVALACWHQDAGGVSLNGKPV